MKGTRKAKNILNEPKIKPESTAAIAGSKIIGKDFFMVKCKVEEASKVFTKLPTIN